MKVRELLQRYLGKDACLLLPEGNKGDGLIYMGAITLLKKYDINFTEIRYPRQVSGKTLFVLGSGGFCGPYHQMPEIISFYMDRFEEIIICPSSFDIRCDIVRRFIKNLPEKVTLFCRERYSYDQVLYHTPYKKNVFLDHDLAFSFNYDKWRLPGKGRLNAFRTDREGLPGRYIPKDNHDVSLNKEGRGEPLQPLRWNELLEAVSRYEGVHTDRAHVAIASAMLGRQTYVYPNSYHKIKGIYEYSLANLPNVKWAGAGYRISLMPSLVLRSIKLLVKKARRAMTRAYLSPLIFLYHFVKKDDITVVLAIKNIDDSCLINCLTSIRRQTYNQSLVEIALVDYDSQARLGLLYKKACERFHAKYIRADDRPVWCRANALNIGIKRARTKYILSADVDIIFEKNYIEEGIKELKKRPFQVIVNAALDLPDIPINDKTYDELKSSAAPRHNLKYSTGINLTFTNFYHRLRGYDEEYKLHYAEDDDLLKRFQLFGLRPKTLSVLTSYLHQYHEKFRNFKHIDGFWKQRIDNSYRLLNTNSITRNRMGWGE